MISGTIQAWTDSLGLDRKTLIAACGRAGIVIRPREELTAAEIFRAITGDKEAAATRKLNAEAEKVERENREAEGEILTVEQAATIYGQKMSALVQGLDSLPSMVPGINLEQRQILVEQIELCKKQGREA